MKFSWCCEVYLRAFGFSLREGGVWREAAVCVSLGSSDLLCTCHFCFFGCLIACFVFLVVEFLLFWSILRDKLALKALDLGKFSGDWSTDCRYISRASRKSWEVLGYFVLVFLLQFSTSISRFPAFTAPGAILDGIMSPGTYILWIKVL